jgi:hypothetical protein
MTHRNYWMDAIMEYELRKWGERRLTPAMIQKLVFKDGYYEYATLMAAIVECRLDMDKKKYIGALRNLVKDDEKMQALRRIGAVLPNPCPPDDAVKSLVPKLREI